MEKHAVSLGDGVHMPLLGLGTWELHGRDAYDALSWALESGYRHFDTATIYDNESELGAALRDSSVARHEVFITTKLPPSKAGDERRSLQRSLEALGTDYIDLWLIHWPPNSSGVAMWEAFAQLAQEGLTRAIGVSNYSPKQIDELAEKTGVVPAVNQIEWSPFCFDRSQMEQNRARGVVLEGYSPFKSSRLDHPLLEELAERHEHTPAQIILRWHLEHAVAVIPKSAQRERILANMDIFDFSLDSEEIAALDGLSNSG